MRWRVTTVLLLAVVTTACALRPRYSSLIAMSPGALERRHQDFVLRDKNTGEPLEGVRVQLENQVVVTRRFGEFRLEVSHRLLRDDPPLAVYLPKGVTGYEVVPVEGEYYPPRSYYELRDKLTREPLAGVELELLDGGSLTTEEDGRIPFDGEGPPLVLSLPSHEVVSVVPPAGGRYNPLPEVPRVDWAGQARVVIKVRVEVDGTVSRVELLEGEEPFVAAVVSAVRRWKYLPGRVNGEVTPRSRRVEVVFQGRRGEHSAPAASPSAAAPAAAPP